MKAMIFAAGLGTRFKPWTDSNPKALAIVNGKSLLQRNIEYLQQYGVTEVIVNVHHFAARVIDAIHDNHGWGSNVTISDESQQLLETGGGLWHAKDLLTAGQPFITINADILTDLDLNALIAFHKDKNSLVSLAITGRKTSRYFLLDDDNRLCGWQHTGTGEERISIPGHSLYQKAYSCVAVFQPEIFSLIPQRGKFSLTETFLSLAADQPIFGYDHSGDKFVDVGKTESIAIAEKLFA
jgi:NDP-sugar pyrophosphorylase family protein